jgi:hypothetical protein
MAVFGCLPGRRPLGTATPLARGAQRVSSNRTGGVPGKAAPPACREPPDRGGPAHALEGWPGRRRGGGPRRRRRQLWAQLCAAPWRPARRSRGPSLDAYFYFRHPPGTPGGGRAPPGPARPRLPCTCRPAEPPCQSRPLSGRRTPLSGPTPVTPGGSGFFRIRGLLINVVHTGAVRPAGGADARAICPQGWGGERGRGVGARVGRAGPAGAGCLAPACGAGARCEEEGGRTGQGGRAPGAVETDGGDTPAPAPVPAPGAQPAERAAPRHASMAAPPGAARSRHGPRALCVRL